MTAESAPRTPGQEPQVLTATVTAERVPEALEQIAAAVHEYVRVHRHPPRYLVLHPRDAAVLLPHLRAARARTPLPEERTAPLTDRVWAQLGRGGLLLSDTEDPAWEAPPDA
jgi:hypothetical protein